MKRGILLAVLALQCAGSVVNAGLQLGSRDSGFWVTAGTLDLNEKTFDRGTIRHEGGTLTDAVLTDSFVEKPNADGSGTTDRVKLTGSIASSGVVTLKDEQILTIESGSQSNSVQVGADEDGDIIARIEGGGDLRGGITIGAGTEAARSNAYLLEMDLRGTVSQDVTFNPGLVETNGGASVSDSTATLKLLNDLQLADLVKIQVAGSTSDSTTSTINCNGNTLSFGSADVTVPADVQVLNWNDASIALNAKLTVGVAGAVKGWTFLDSGFINGRGNELALLATSGSVLTVNDSATLTFVDTHLTGGTATNFALGTTSGTAVFENTTIKDANSAIHVRVTNSSSATSPTGGQFFGTDLTWNDATIELLGNLTLPAATTWTFEGASTINGAGNVVDLTAATPFIPGTPGTPVVYWDPYDPEHPFANDPGYDPEDPVNATVIKEGAVPGTPDSGGDGCGITIADSARLKIRNAILKINSSTVAALSNASSVLDLADCTVILVGDAVTTGLGKIEVNGPVTFITGEYNFNPAGTANVVNNCTLWYDTLSSPDTNNITEDDWITTTGRIAQVASADTDKGDIELSSSANEISNSFFLTPNDGSVLGRYALFDTSSAFTFDGHGRSFIMGDTSATAVGNDRELLKVTGSNGVTLTHIVLDGLLEEHFDSNGTDGTSLFTFGDGTHIRLQKDDVLGTAYTFASAVDGAEMVLDLNGQTLDLNSTGLSVNLSHANGVLIIKNGRLKGVEGTLLDGAVATHVGTIRLQDVDVELSGDVTLTEGKWEVAGHTRFMVGGSNVAREIIFGDALDALPNPTTADAFQINSGATMTLCNGVTFNYKNFAPETYATADFTLASESSTLEIIGGGFTVTGDANGLTTNLQKGRLIVDHIATFTVTNANDTLVLGGNAGDDEDLDMHIMPGAQFKIAGAGTVSYANNPAQP